MNKQKTPEGDSSPTNCSAFRLNQVILYQGEKCTIYDIDEGYGVIALDGDRYIAPGHAANRCVEAPMDECFPLPNPRDDHPDRD